MSDLWVRAKKPAAPDPSVLRTGQLLRGGFVGEVWQVEHVTDCSAKVRQVLGRHQGTTTTWAPSSVGHRFVTPEELETLRAEKVDAKATDRDETRCLSCWPGETSHPLQETEEWLAPGRDPFCPDHRASEETLQKVELAATRKRVVETPADVKRVLELRAGGMAYHLIEREMGWPDKKGGRPYKICKNAGKPAPGIRPNGRKS